MNLPVATHNPLPGAAEAPPGLDQAREWLAYVKPRPQDQRARVAFALFDGWGDAGEPLFFDWLRTHPEHDTAREREGRSTWRSAREPGPVTWRSLGGMAWDAGWRPDKKAQAQRRLSAAELARQQAEREAKAAQAAAERRAKADAAAADARQRLAAADPANPAHPYLKRKGVAPVPTLRQDGAALVIPFENHAGTRGVQIITPDGQKLFQRGASFKGCWWWARPPADGVAAPLLIITEGVADALTVAAAVNEAAVACALSASNLTAVAGALRRCWPAAKIIVAADADEVGRAAAEKAQAVDPRLIVRRPSFDRAR